MIKIFLNSVYKIFFMISILWLLLACISFNIGAELMRTFSLGTMSAVCMLISILLHSFIDDGSPPRKKK